MVLGKSLAARASQEAQRTKTGDEKSNPIAPARSKHSLHFSTKTWTCHRKRLHVYPFWTPYCHFGRQHASKSLSGSVPEGVWNFKFFCYPLGSETDSKRHSKMDWIIWVFSCFLALVSKTAPRGLRDVPRPQKWSDFCLELYLLLPLILLLTATTEENITRKLYEQLVWGCGDDPP